jgi:DNA-binding response OmpR family regulator
VIEDLTNPRPDVLVVEDDVDSAAALSMTLRRSGCLVREAHSLAEAMTMLDPPPAWMVLDLMLPDGDGLSLLNYVHDNAIPTRIAIVTGTSDPIRLWEATKVQPTMLIRKPVDPSEVARRID